MLPGDLVMDRTIVQCDKTDDKVAKLCYAVRGPFKIICGTSHGGYVVRKLNKPDSSKFKFTSEDLYILPPSLKPYERMDGSNTRYLNQYHTSIVNPLKILLNIKLHNGKWFDTPPPTFSPLLKPDHLTLSYPPATTSPFSRLSNIHHKTNTSPPLPLLENVNDDDCSSLTPTALYNLILHSDDLFFFRYTPEDILNLVDD